MPPKTGAGAPARRRATRWPSPSTALRRLREDLHPDRVRALYIHDTAVHPTDFCRQIALELEIEPAWTRALILRDIRLEIERLSTERKLTVLLVLDEAQALRPDVLALLPMLTNFDWIAGTQERG